MDYVLSVGLKEVEKKKEFGRPPSTDLYQLSSKDFFLF